MDGWIGWQEIGQDRGKGLLTKSMGLLCTKLCCEVIKKETVRAYEIPRDLIGNNDILPITKNIAKFHRKSKFGSGEYSDMSTADHMQTIDNSYFARGSKDFSQQDSYYNLSSQMRTFDSKIN